MRILFLINILLAAEVGLAENPRIFVSSVQQKFEDVSVNHFPNFFSIRQVETYVLREAGKRLSAHFNAAEVLVPDFIQVKRNGLHISRLSAEKYTDILNESDLGVTLVSTISRDDFSLERKWTFEILVLSNAGVVLSKRATHPIEPYSVTAYLTQVRWLNQDEFAFIFLSLLDELLGTIPPRNNSIKLGNDQLSSNLIESNMPGFQTYLLSVSGGFATRKKVAYSIDSKQENITRLNYRNKGWLSAQEPELDLESRAVLQKVMSKVPEGIVERRRIRHGLFCDLNETKLKLRYDKLFFRTATRFQSVPDFIQVFDGEELTGRLFYFVEEPENLLQIARDRDVESFGWGSKHFLQGEFNSRFYIIEYDEQSGVIFIKTETDTEAAILLHNMNPDSRSFGGIVVGKNNRKIYYRIKNDLNTEAPAAEWYGLFTKPDADASSLKVYAQLYALLFFALAAN